MTENATTIEAIENYIAECALSEDPIKKAAGRIMGTIATKFDLNKYIDMEFRHLEGEFETKGHGADERKFLDLPFWIYNKAYFTYLIGLHGEQSKRVLDLGSGAGHFLLINNMLNHVAHGIDVPNALFDDICDFFKLQRMHYTIAPHVPMPVPDEKYDYVTAFYVNFNTDYYTSTKDDRGDNAWGEDEWDYFLSDVSNNLLTKDGYIWMMINPSNNAKTGLRQADNSLIPYFKRKGADIINEEMRIVRIANLNK